MLYIFFITQYFWIISALMANDTSHFFLYQNYLVDIFSPTPKKYTYNITRSRSNSAGFRVPTTDLLLSTIRLVMVWELETPAPGFGVWKCEKWV